MVNYRRTGVTMHKDDKEFCDIHNLSPTELLRERIRELRANHDALKKVEELHSKIEKMAQKLHNARDFISNKDLINEFIEKYGIEG